MPIYEFSCESCQTRFETLVLRKDESVQCPKCGGSQLQKRISAHAVGHSQATADASCPVPGCSRGPCSLNCQ